MKKHSGCLYALILFSTLGFFSSSSAAEEFGAVGHGRLSNAEVNFIRRRQLLYYNDEFGDRGEKVTVDPSLVFANDRQRDAYIALQAWKKAILSDPRNYTGNWVGSEVCTYSGVFCAPAPYNRFLITVAGIDLNHGDIAGYLPEELGLLVDLALFHINSNRFCGTVPHKFHRLKLLFELDLSNNRFAGKFPRVVLSLPSLKFLDLRYNEFEGAVPKELFDKDLDAIFINHNRFRFQLPENFGNSPVSVVVVAGNKFHGCVPASIGNMSRLNEIILMDNGLRACLPSEIGRLKNVTVFDVSYNELLGPLPDAIGGMVSLEQLDVAHNMFTGSIPASICDGFVIYTTLRNRCKLLCEVAQRNERHITLMYLLMLLGSIVFTDKSGQKVKYLLLLDHDRAGRYAWDVGVLTNLYRHLSMASRAHARGLIGCQLLLRMWIWA